MRYCAYGSNMSAETIEERNIRYSRRVCAILRGHSLKFNKVASRNRKEGYANIVPDEERIVEGVLYDMPDSELSKLDKCEGHPDHYDRVKMWVQLDDGQEVQAFVYVAQPHKVKEALKPNREYLDHLSTTRDIVSESYHRRLASWETLD